jgi:hypothetical protein
MYDPNVDQAVISERDAILADLEETDNVPPSLLESETLYRTLRSWFELDAAHSHEWRTNAREDYDFAAGDQWEEDVRRELEAQGRPVITFNRVLSVIKAVAGIEINGRHETIFIPRDTGEGDVKINEILSQASQWMGDGCDAEDEQSEAFQDSLICGMGWSESIIDHEEDPDGKYIERRVDPLEMYWDRDARAKNLIDGRRIWRVRRMSLDDARSFVQGLGVNVPDSELNAAWAASAGFGDTSDPKPIEDRRLRDENVELPFDPRSEVYIVQVQWWERERYWRVADFGGNQTSDLSEDEFMTLKSRAQKLGIDVIAAPMTRRKYKQAFLGASILGPIRDCPAGNRFNFTCITGEKHRNKGYWFGLTRIMRDPQLWANKWLSQTLHILNSTAKGGIIAEVDAFDDQRQAEASYAQPNEITWAARDAIQKNKIMQKPGVAMASGHYVNLLEFAISSIRDVTGINLELLGMRDANQPGILEAQRKQAALTILATLFDSLRRFRKEVGRIRLHYIQNYLSDGRLIRISGGENFRLIPLLRDNTIGNYDVIVDDAPTSPNQKEQTWGILMQMLPMFRDMLTPEIAMMILEYSPLPAKFVEAMKQLASEPNPEAAMQKQLVMEKGKAEIIDLQSRAKKTLAGAGLDEAKTASERVGAVLDIAKAASEMGQAKLDQAQAEAIEADTARRDELSRLPPPSEFDNPFLVGPDLSGPQLPSLPSLPVYRGGGNNQPMPMGLATQGGIVPEAEPELLEPPFANVYEGR